MVLIVWVDSAVTVMTFIVWFAFKEVVASLVDFKVKKTINWWVGLGDEEGEARNCSTISHWD